MLLIHLTVSTIGPALMPVVPAGKWGVDYGVNQCTAQREFATPTGSATLLLKPSPTSDVIQINLIENERGRIAIEKDVELTIDGAQPAAFRELSFGSGKLTIRQVNLPGEYAAKFERAASIGWASRGARMRFNTGSMAKVMKELRACKESLREYWNVSPEKQGSLKSPPKTVKPIQSLFDSRDYPRQAAKQGSTGVASIIALIDENGLVRDCMLDATSGFSILDAMTCAVITERGEFEPAIGADGKPARSHVALRVAWELP